MSTNFVKRLGAFGAVALLAVVVSGMAPAGAAIANPAVTDATITVKTTVTNAGHGTATPDSFTYHVIRASDSADVADGIFSHSGTTKIKVPPGTYAVTEDSMEPYVEHVSGCAHEAVTVASPKSCTISNVWTFAKIKVSTSISNAGGGKAKASAFRYHVVDANTNATVKSGQFNDSGTTTISLPDGTYSVTEDLLDGYNEDYSSCADLTIDLADPATCIVNNTFDPHATTTISNTSTTRPGSTQEKVHGTATFSASCQMTLQPALQDPSTVADTITLSADAFPDPHKGDPITLSNTKFAVTTPASLLQTGVDLGIINNGDILPEKGTLVISGVGTTEGTKTYKFNTSETVVVSSGGKALPLTATATLPNSTWTPNNATDPVFFSVTSLKVVQAITSAQIGGTVTSTSACKTPSAPSFLALSSQGGPIPTTTLGSGGGSGGTGGSGGAGSGTGSGGSGSGTGAEAGGAGILPVTGTSVWVWLAPAVLFIYIGLLAIGATARKRRRILN